ncbi:hypothetical protein MC885_017959 [Smutsia gigantea]|nr:hypothetical protein MC885_017959 [Smutsia gigantea]
MAAESALQVVEKLQARLAANPDPKKLLKNLKKLSTLPITVDILAETGVGKTVNSLRKHEHVGSFARDLVAQWKKLVPVERNTEPDEQDFEKSNSRKRPRDAVQREEEVEGDYQEHWRASSSQPYSPDHRQKHKKLSELERPHKVSHGQERRDERRRCHRISPVYSSDHESSDYGHVQSPPSSASPHQMSMDHYRSPEEDHEPFVPHQKPGKGHSNAFQDRLGVSQERHLEEPPGKGVVSQNKEHRSSHREKRPVDARGDERSCLSREKSHKAISKEENRRPLSGESTKEKLSSSGVKKEKEKESGTKKKYLPPLEAASDNHLKKPKHEDSEKTKSDRHRPGLDSLHTGKGAGGQLPKGKDKVSNNLKTQEGKGKTSHLDRKSAGSLPKAEDADMDDEFEQPTMSFESYLSYDQPRKKKKKIVKTSNTALGGKGLKKNDSKSSSKNLNSAQKLPKVNETKSETLQPTGANSAKLKKVPIDALPALPDLPLPMIQANYRPLPSLELISSFQPKRKEEEAGFTGRRMNSKMQVYSGSKCAYLPKMMTLHQQCIRVLKNNIDSIFEVGGVPYSVLEPVLERCTPDQLYRIEEYNHVSILFGWKEGGFLAWVFRNGFVSVNRPQLKGRQQWSGHHSEHVWFVYGPLNKHIFSTYSWHQIKVGFKGSKKHLPHIL